VDMATAPRKDGNLASNNPAEYDCSRSIFVGNIPFDVEDEDLYAVFGTNLDPEMSVEAIRVPRDPQTSIGKGFGFVLFKSKVSYILYGPWMLFKSMRTCASQDPKLYWTLIPKKQDPEI
jgi:RNA recognition motif-containing protein